MKRLILTIFLLAFAPVTAVAELGDDGLHKADWMRDTFKDLSEDLEEANAEGKRLMIIFEQRGCVYCAKMHEEVFPDPDVTQMIEDIRDCNPRPGSAYGSEVVQPVIPDVFVREATDTNAGGSH